MNDWFTVEPIDGGTFAISEYGHWEEPHCYLLCGTERALLIDTGLGVADIKAVTDRLTPLPITVAATHVHWDHIGGHRHFQEIAVHEAERDWLSVRFPIPLEAVRRNLTAKPCRFPDGFALEGYRIFQGRPTSILRDGDCLDLGNRRVTVLHTPGHSPGHCCFYEPDRGYLYSGDLIYCGCLDAFYPSTDPELFLQSVRKVQALGAGRVLPGHHTLQVPDGIVDRISDAFCGLKAAGKLKQGNGVFDFGEFQIHI